MNWFLCVLPVFVERRRGQLAGGWPPAVPAASPPPAAQRTQHPPAGHSPQLTHDELGEREANQSKGRMRANKPPAFARENRARALNGCMM
eukprot:m.432011 g.432011  ORF g.432011 m.432011 type:complete len:90 (+) comp56744_c0_seq14:519-788(+)